MGTTLNDFLIRPSVKVTWKKKHEQSMLWLPIFKTLQKVTRESGIKKNLNKVYFHFKLSIKSQNLPQKFAKLTTKKIPWKNVL